MRRLLLAFLSTTLAAAAPQVRTIQEDCPQGSRVYYQLYVSEDADFGGVNYFFAWQTQESLDIVSAWMD
jgi:hypothetical protein